ncbi:MAG: hypothetical protein GY794_12460, partial [bacterium]|nr:hypothetical protein [bacterium]
MPTAKNAVPGCITLKAGRYYWKLPKFAADLLGGRTWVPLLPPGSTRGATKNRRVAESVRLRMWRQLRRDSAKNPSLGLEAILEAFEQHIALGSSPLNARENAGKIRNLFEFAAAKNLQPDEVTPGTVEAFLGHLKTDGRADCTLYNYYTAIKNLSDWGNHPRRSIFLGDLLDGIPRPRQAKPQLRYLTKHQAARAWHTIHRTAPDIERYFLLALWTGARRAELSSIT